MPQYSAKLLFQSRIVHNGVTPRRRLCEERIISFKAGNDKAALAKARKLGRGGEHDYKSIAGGHVFVEFLGVMELMELVSSRDGEVWYEFAERLDPDRRLKTLLLTEGDQRRLRNAKRRRKR